VTDFRQFLPEGGALYGFLYDWEVFLEDKATLHKLNYSKSMIVREIYKKIGYLMVTMALVALVSTAIGTAVVYQVAIDEERMRLIETVESQARLMEAVARFDKQHLGVDAFEATLSQLREAHRNFQGFGETGEFTLAKLENEQIIFLLNHRHDDLNELRPVPFGSTFAEPMRRALKGRSGTVVGLDYRGEMVLASFEPVKELGLGIVAKVDIDEIRAPFIRAAWVSLAVTLAFITLGLFIFYCIAKPLQQRITTALRSIEGIVPICAWCGSSIKDENDEWIKLDKFIAQNSQASVSHGMCPDCAKNFGKELTEAVQSSRKNDLKK